MRRLRLMLLAAILLPFAVSKARTQDEQKIKVSFQGTDLETLAKQVERVTKKTFLYQEALLKNKKVTLQAEKPLAPDEFYRVFQTVCHMNGLALVPVKESSIDLVKIVQTQQAQKEPGDQPVLVQGEDLPQGDALIYYLVTPKHVGAERAMTILSTGISQTGIVQRIAGSELILLIDVATAIRRAERLLGLVDVPGPEVVGRAVVLDYLPASQAQAQLSQYFQAFAKARGTAGEGRLVVLPDERLNTLHLIGPEKEVAEAEAYLARVDQEVPPARRTIQYYKLKNAPVLDVVDTVRQLLGLAVAAREAEEETPAPGSGAAPRQRSPAAPGAPPRPPAPPEAPRPSERQPARPPTAPGMEPGFGFGAPLPSDVEVVPIESLNTLVVIGKQSVHEEVAKILENLDVRKGQVLMEVAIVQITGDDSVDFGLEALQEDRKGDGAIVGGGTGFGLGAQEDSDTSGFPDAHTLSGFTGGALRYIKPQDISVIVRAIASKSNVSILSQPLLLVNDNESADFSTRVSEPTLAVSQGTATTTTAFGGFAEAVTSLQITPQVSTDGYLNLKITQSFEEFTGAAPSAGVPPPKVSNQVTTVVTVPDNHTVILGGFVRDAVTDTRTGIPIVKDIPILGSLLSQTSKSVTKSRLYLFVRPRILSRKGFDDLEATSGEKRRDVRKFTRGTPLEEAVDEAFRTPPGPRVKEARLPFSEKTPKIRVKR